MFDCRDNRLTPDVTLGLVARFELHPTTLLVLAAVVDHDMPDRAGNRKGLVWPKVERLVVLTQRSRRTVQYHLRRLERAGLISATGNGGRSRPATIMIHWAAIMGEPKPCNRAPWKARETVQRPAPAEKQEKEKKQGDAPAASPGGPPPRRGPVDDSVAPPAGLREALLGVTRRVSAPVAPTTAQRPHEAPSPLTDRVLREEWLADQHARAVALGLR